MQKELKMYHGATAYLIFAGTRHLAARNVLPDRYRQSDSALAVGAAPEYALIRHDESPISYDMGVHNEVVPARVP